MRTVTMIFKWFRKSSVVSVTQLWNTVLYICTVIGGYSVFMPHWWSKMFISESKMYNLTTKTKKGTDQTKLYLDVSALIQPLLLDDVKVR